MNGHKQVDKKQIFNIRVLGYNEYNNACNLSNKNFSIELWDFLFEKKKHPYNLLMIIFKGSDF